MKIFSRVFVSILALAVVPSSLPASDSETGVIVMSNGGSRAWNKSVKEAVRNAELPCPYRIFFGMGDTASQVRELQRNVRELEGKGAHTIIVVPLLISSYSQVARQWKYLFGIDVQPGFINNPLFPVEKHSTIRFVDPLNDSSAVVEILLDRAQEISEDKSKESVVIVSQGPNDESDNVRWSQILGSLSHRIRERAGFRSVEGVSLRDDAPSAVRARAIQNLRARIQAINNSGSKALVVLLLISQGGIENKLALELRGLPYTLNTKPLLPDARLSDWIRSQVP